MAETTHERYRLVYRGEVLEDQHVAVVRKRLGSALKLEGERLEMLFAGRGVVLKQDADPKTAAKYQEVFKRCGAKLRVVPLRGSTPLPADAAVGPVAEPQAASGAAAEAALGEPAEVADGQAHQTEKPPAEAPKLVPATSAAELDIMPHGYDILTAEERVDAAPTAVQVDVSHLAIQKDKAVFVIDDSDPNTAPAKPDEAAEKARRAKEKSAGFTLADVGSDIGQTSDDEPLVEIDVHFEIAELGARMGITVPEAPVIDPDTVDYELAEIGARIGPEPKPVAHPTPDTSALSLQQA